MNSLLNYDYDEMISFMESNNEKPYRAKQVFEWLYRKRVDSIDAMTNLSKDLRQRLKESTYVDSLEMVTKQESSDGTIKFLFRCADGALIETVLMVSDYGYSVCVTSQVGCNMGCKFCASGLLKKERNLSAAEMVTQVLYVQREIDAREKRVSHIVVMGIGEPMDNYDNVMRFIRTVNHDLGLGIGARHITVSTCGVVPMIKKFAQEKTQVNLAISLHAPNNELRSEIMPINQRFPIEKLMESLHYYLDLNHRRLTFEYILLDGVNDQVEHALQLSKLIKGMNAYVNLIPYNPVSEHGYKRTPMNQAMDFLDVLMKHGIQATIRQEKGTNIDAACGQLRANNLKKAS
ncbi:23S rRNA (adenine(2503)-C2)-methyltransferase [Erysipelothrix larvae]|uniref:Probable dual-specificity RNA methyltransferase RlmN n=1 Tax=Erysipelothrix larvae TaxID=1514105 RepID=A0A0X8GYL5_9FIRM|nr:23S rRNA (adenine(2503)-C(2))-methyltransferase RlmN [Erysipelothrix larvae]AMC92813.1 23S rRNA (adenine(2503)-C2)-methyltransferase [Erysipelothrix larvae]